MEGVLILGATSFYAGAGAALAVRRGNRSRRPWPLYVLAAGLACNAAAIAWRWVEAGRPPFSSMYESLILFACTLVTLGFVFEVKKVQARIGLLASLAGAGVLLGARSFDSTIEPLPPALRSIWLPIHVAACLVAYGAFAIACAASVRWLCLDRRGQRSEESMVHLEATNSGAVAVGFVFLSFGILSGAVWANRTWGSYWGWDPKETWSLITWLIYATALHLRFAGSWSAKRLAWFSVAGFLSVAFLYWGVTYLLPGLHGYAQ